MKFEIPSKLIATCLLLLTFTACGAGLVEQNNEIESEPQTEAPQPTVPDSNKWLTAYYPSYQQFSMPPSEVDYESLTHLIHWPVVPNPDGSLNTAKMDFTAAHSQDVVTRAHAAGIKVLLGIGGDSDSGATAGFKGATRPENRQAFINNIVTLMKDRAYDGVDINWEEIKPGDDAQFVAFIRELRQALDANQARPLLTMAPTTGDDGRPELIAQVADFFDQINLQTYVMSGAYDGWVTWFNSPLENGGFEFPDAPGQQVPSIAREIGRFADAGIPMNRMGLGAQLAGFIWAGGTGTTTGGVTRPRQSWTVPPTVSLIDYSDIVTELTGAKGYLKQFDAVAGVPYLSLDSNVDSQDRFVSYEDLVSIQKKIDFLKDAGLGGMFLFEITGDYFPGNAPGDRHPLVKAAAEAL